MTDDHEVFEQSAFRLQHGAVLPQVRLAYKTHGTLAARKDNVVLFPTWFSSTHENNRWLIGPGRPLDPERHFIVCVNLLGNGLSSSPSNTPAPFDRMRFPAVSVLDNVRLQADLLQTRFGIDQIALVIGRSMGAQTAFQWAAWYPERVRAMLALCGSARTTPHNVVFLEGVKAALTTDAAWRDGEYTAHAVPAKGLRAIGRLYAGWAMSQAFYRRELFRQEGFASVDEYLQKRWDGNFAARDANDLLCMLQTWKTFDVAGNDRFGGDLARALSAMTCKAIVMPSATDLYFPPEDSAMAVAGMPDAQLRVIDSVWGHRAGSPGSDPRDIAFIGQAIDELLR